MSYSNYPDAVKNNAKRGLELNEKQGNKCATPVGKKRGADLADGRALSLDTVARLFNYLTRSKVYYKPEEPKPVAPSPTCFGEGQPLCAGLAKSSRKRADWSKRHTTWR